MRASDHPDFIEALARGLDVIVAFGTAGRARGPSASSPRPRACRGRPPAACSSRSPSSATCTSTRACYALTPRVLELGTSYVSSSNIWALARPHLTELVHRTAESCSIAQLDGSRHRLRRPGRRAEARDPVGRHRHAVPRRAHLPRQGAARRAARGRGWTRCSRSRRAPASARSGSRTAREIDAELAQVRRQGWALTDQQLAPAIRSIAAPIRDAAGDVVAAVNINAHALETEVEVLTDRYLPWLLRAASAISADLTLWQSRPIATVVPEGRAAVS